MKNVDFVLINPIRLEKFPIYVIHFTQIQIVLNQQLGKREREKRVNKQVGIQVQGHNIFYSIYRQPGERTWLSVAKIHLYFTITPRDKWGVFSHAILDAESDSGLQIRILSIFDPQNPLFGSKNDPFSKNFLSTSFIRMLHLFLKLIKCTLLIYILFCKIST